MDEESVLKPGSDCTCGRPLPWHLIGECGFSVGSHTCACERHYVSEDGKLRHVGRRANPFARYDQENQ